MPKVYIIQETNKDYRDAEEFGELVFLSQDRRDDFHNVKNSAHNLRLIAHLRQGMRDYDPSTDYVVLTGSPYVQAAVFMLIGRMFPADRGFTLLRWDNRDLRYIPLTIEF